MTTPLPSATARKRTDRVPGSYVVVYSLLTILAVGLVSHGVYMAIDNRLGTHHLFQPTTATHEQTDPILINNDRMLASVDERSRKSDLKEGIWELTIGIPFLGWAG